MNPDFYKMTEAKDFDVINHNERDFDSFRKFQDRLNERYEQIEDKRGLDERIANVKKWDDHLPPRWAGSNLKSIDNPAAKVAAGMIKEHGFSSFFIRGKPGVGKTFLSFAIARKLIAQGFVSPSQIKIISEESLLAIPKLGFQGAGRFDKLLSNEFKLYLFDNVGVRPEYDKRENPLWEQLLDHIYTKSLAAIFTSTGSAKGFAEKLSSPAESKFTHLINGNIITMSGPVKNIELDGFTEDEEDEINQEDLKVGLFDAFSKK